MSEPTPREALREKIDAILMDYLPDMKGGVTYGASARLERIVNAEVLAFADRLESKMSHLSSFSVHQIITQEKQRYGGKEQGK